MFVRRNSRSPVSHFPSPHVFILVHYDSTTAHRRVLESPSIVLASGRNSALHSTELDSTVRYWAWDDIWADHSCQQCIASRGVALELRCRDTWTCYNSSSNRNSSDASTDTCFVAICNVLTMAKKRRRRLWRNKREKCSSCALFQDTRGGNSGFKCVVAIIRRCTQFDQAQRGSIGRRSEGERWSGWTAKNLPGPGQGNCCDVVRKEERNG